jgi:hypothetical protein
MLRSSSPRMSAAPSIPTPREASANDGLQLGDRLSGPLYSACPFCAAKSCRHPFPQTEILARSATHGKAGQRTPDVEPISDLADIAVLFVVLIRVVNLRKAQQVRPAR